ncbi:hypothetical protein CC1G_07877 [Coprinopsis cinerea okayama7|uniref:NAD-dependent epimerase/dehydratase domain-containing protein n=1 Tax=Coprinopsis cinerea (strain Okayama-7 / 130 / ATCC MYA-4618 / FGSC 9003) TaxID=240176 RepID=A8P457_COPC7|nr:hypothetical protein CC1G_07877 [Coprinopsis cinerea okayama7\|eukprot:XP_001838686.2 hypothetical protein CC1G_07877 [Coprinopsis cinerea okayama7\
MTVTKIFVTGGRGYIGGTVVDRLLEHPDFKSFEITVLTQSMDAAEALHKLGLKTIIGDYSKLDLLTKATSETDMSMQCADNYPAAKAILDGMKQRFESTNTAPILIHTSGTGFTLQMVNGMHSNLDKVVSDLDSDTIEAIPEDVWHRNVDIPIVKADEEGYVRAYLVAPSLVFGVPSGKLAQLGVQYLKSGANPSLFKASIARKRPGYVGGGENVWSAVSVDDLADLYMLIFNAARTSPDKIGHGRDGFYIAETCDYRPKEIMRTVGEVLAKLGLVEDAEPNSFTESEVEEHIGSFLGSVIAGNCKAKGERSRALGWAPLHDKEALLKSVADELHLYLKENNIPHS